MSKYSDNQKRRLIERGIVRALLAHMAARGWSAWRTWDGEEQQPLGNEQERRAGIMAACFNLDEVSVRFVPVSLADEHEKARRREGDQRDPAEVQRVRRLCAASEHGVLLVMGNGEDIISDWSYSEGDADGFSAAMEAFSKADGEPYGRDLAALGMRTATDVDRIAVLSDWLHEESALPVLFKGEDGLRRVGEVPGCFRGSLSDATRVALAKAGIAAEDISVTLEEVDAYPGGWKKRALLAEVRA